MLSETACLCRLFSLDLSDLLVDLAYGAGVSLYHVVHGGSGRVGSEGSESHILVPLEDRIGACVLVDVADQFVQFRHHAVHGHKAIVAKADDVF